MINLVNDLKMKYIFVTILFLYYCNTYNNINESNNTNIRAEKELTECLRNNGKDYNGDKINLYNILINTEAVLIKEKMLRQNDKNTYLQLYKKIKEGEINSKDIIKKINEKVPQSYLITVPTNFTSILYCYGYVIENNTSLDKRSVLNKEYRRLKYIFEEGDNSFLQYKKLIDILNNGGFHNPVYRVPVIALLYSQIENNNQK
jgi:hypothetical protein